MCSGSFLHESYRQAYETLARRSELVALEVRDIELLPDGTGRALIRRGKTDEGGQGRVAYLSRETPLCQCDVRHLTSTI